MGYPLQYNSQDYFLQRAQPPNMGYIKIHKQSNPYVPLYGDLVVMLEYDRTDPFERNSLPETYTCEVVEMKHVDYLLIIEWARKQTSAVYVTILHKEKYFRFNLCVSKLMFPYALQPLYAPVQVTITYNDGSWLIDLDFVYRIHPNFQQLINKYERPNDSGSMPIHVSIQYVSNRKIINLK